MADGNDPKLWRRVSRCESRECVEVAFAGNEVFVRNSRRPEGPTVTFTAEEWAVFCAGVQAGELHG
jgi:hypothetical protein